MGGLFLEEEGCFTWSGVVLESKAGEWMNLVSV